jgi:hypothetical protein
MAVGLVIGVAAGAVPARALKTALLVICLMALF